MPKIPPTISITGSLLVMSPEKMTRLSSAGIPSKKMRWNSPPSWYAPNTSRFTARAIPAFASSTAAIRV